MPASKKGIIAANRTHSLQLQCSTGAKTGHRSQNRTAAAVAAVPPATTKAAPCFHSHTTSVGHQRATSCSATASRKKTGVSLQSSNTDTMQGQVSIGACVTQQPPATADTSHISSTNARLLASVSHPKPAVVFMLLLRPALVHWLLLLRPPLAPPQRWMGWPVGSSSQLQDTEKNRQVGHTRRAGQLSTMLREQQSGQQA